MNKIVFLVAGFIIGLVGYASAANLHRPSGYYVVSAGGTVSRDGRVIGGHGFTVSHPQQGEYIVSFSPYYFGNGVCAAVTVEGVHHALLSHVESICLGSTISFDIHITEPQGGPRDHEFQFAAVGWPPP